MLSELLPPKGRGLLAKIVKKVTLGIESSDGLKIDSMAVTCVKDDFSDATDSDLRIHIGQSYILTRSQKISLIQS